MSWAEAYLGIPERDHGRGFDGCDCWGLVRLVYQRELGCDLPCYAGAVDLAEREEIDRIMQGARDGGMWRPVPKAEIQAFDVLTFRQGPVTCHIGVAVTRALMLHMKGRAHVARLDHAHYRLRLTGVYRHFNTPFKGLLTKRPL